MKKKVQMQYKVIRKCLSKWKHAHIFLASLNGERDTNRRLPKWSLCYRACSFTTGKAIFNTNTCPICQKRFESYLIKNKADFKHIPDLDVILGSY